MRQVCLQPSYTPGLAGLNNNNRGIESFSVLCFNLTIWNALIYMF